MTVTIRCDLEARCQVCKANFVAVGKLGFVTGAVAEFEEVHRQLHGKEDDSGTQRRRAENATRVP